MLLSPSRYIRGNKFISYKPSGHDVRYLIHNGNFLSNFDCAWFRVFLREYLNAFYIIHSEWSHMSDRSVLLAIIFSFQSYGLIFYKWIQYASLFFTSRDLRGDSREKRPMQKSLKISHILYIWCDEKRLYATTETYYEGISKKILPEQASSALARLLFYSFRGALPDCDEH